MKDGVYEVGDIFENNGKKYLVTERRDLGQDCYGYTLQELNIKTQVV